MTQQDKIINKLDTTNVIVALRDDEIIHVFYKNNITIDINVLYEILESINKICSNKKYCFIFEAGENVKMTKEARDYTFKLEKYIPFKASCVIAQNRFYQIIAEFFYLIKKPSQPYSFFVNFNDGIDWLKKKNEDLN